MNLAGILRSRYANQTPQPATNSKKFLVMESPVLILEKEAEVDAGEYQLPIIEGTISINGPKSCFSSSIPCPREAFIISSIVGNGVLNLKNVVIMANKISSPCKLVVNVENSQIISEGLTLENVTLNISDSSIVTQPCSGAGIVLKESVLNSKNVNFTLFTWLDKLNFLEAHDSAANIKESEFVFVSGQPRPNIDLTLVSAIGGNHELVQNKVFIISRSIGKVKVYDLRDTSLIVKDLEIESTITDLSPPSSINSSVSLNNVTVNGQLVTVPAQAQADGLATSRVGFPHSTAPVTVLAQGKASTQQPPFVASAQQTPGQQQPPFVASAQQQPPFVASAQQQQPPFVASAQQQQPPFVASYGYGQRKKNQGYYAEAARKYKEKKEQQKHKKKSSSSECNKKH